MTHLRHLINTVDCNDPKRLLAEKIVKFYDSRKHLTNQLIKDERHLGEQWKLRHDHVERAKNSWSPISLLRELMP
jgi:hypothetical protein